MSGQHHFDYLSLGNLILDSMTSAQSTPNSPSLTHSSSAIDDFDSFLDPNAFQQDEPDGLLLNTDYTNYFTQDDNSWKVAPDTPADYNFAINPSLLYGPQSTEQPQTDVDMLHGVIGEPIAEEEEEEEEEVPAPKKKRQARQQPKRKTKQTVADLALPLEAADVPVAVTAKEKDAKGHLPHIVFPVPDYIDRPSAEDYSKLSSKEKRQLRNKISARNFRHRRKEYITTLEGEIATRDANITNLEDQVSSLQLENKTLRTDLDILKKTVEDLLNKSRPADHPPAPSTSVRPVSPRPNMAKDRSPFTASSWAAGGFGALPNINVHTTLVPSPTLPLFPARNMNPKMQHFNKDAAGFHLPNAGQEDESFLGSNPFILNADSMNRYRSQLYSKVSHNINQSGSTGFKPAFFSAPTNSAEADQEIAQVARNQTALVAHEATRTLVGGLFKSFWNTFSGTNPHTQSQQVADLLSGKAELKVVPASQGIERATAGADAKLQMNDLDKSMAKLTVGSSFTLFSGRKQ